MTVKHANRRSRRFLTHVAPLLLAIGLILPAAGCKSHAKKAATAAKTATKTAKAPPTQLMVFAAASLTNAYGDLARSFEKQHAGVHVLLHFAGSQMLRTQIENGAQADVFASANVKHMQALLKKHLVDQSSTFAHNSLVIIVPPKNPAHITSAKQLPRAKRIVIGDAQVPVGRYTRKFLALAAKTYGADFTHKVQAHVVSDETNVRLVLAKVSLGEADAGVVYRTDAKVGGKKVKTIPIPAALNINATYPIAVVKAAPHPKLAASWVKFVLSPAGQKILASYGFLPAKGNAAKPSKAVAKTGGHAQKPAATHPAAE